MKGLRALAILGVAVFAAAGTSVAENKGDEKPQVVVDGAAKTLKAFAADDSMVWFRNNVQKAATTDILSFSRAAGLFGGVSVEGAAIAVRKGYNEAYYSKGVRPVDILVTRNQTNPAAETLRVTAAQVAGR